MSKISPGIFACVIIHRNIDIGTEYFLEKVNFDLCTQIFGAFLHSYLGFPSKNFTQFSKFSESL